MKYLTNSPEFLNYLCFPLTTRTSSSSTGVYTVIIMTSLTYQYALLIPSRVSMCFHARKRVKPIFHLAFFGSRCGKQRKSICVGNISDTFYSSKNNIFNKVFA